jgi:endonuclease/exonuclease/phosphatase family metal-dependent hydrolase
MLHDTTRRLRVTSLHYISQHCTNHTYTHLQKQYEQAVLLLKQIDKARTSLRAQHKECVVHVILAGNFNMVPDSRTYKLIVANNSVAASGNLDGQCVVVFLSNVVYPELCAMLVVLGL